jgi:hypothetical protein
LEIIKCKEVEIGNKMGDALRYHTGIKNRQLFNDGN